MQTMKVSTTPLSKEMAMEMDDIYVSSQLLMETNRPANSLLQSGNMKQQEINPMTSENHGLGCSTQSVIKDKQQVDQIQTEQILLESYKEMLGLDKTRILITAESGYGKSTLFKKIAHDWAVLQKTKSKSTDPQAEPSPLSKYKLVFVLNIKEMGTNFNIIDAMFSQILPITNDYTKPGLENYINKHPNEVLILLDGADEMSFETLDSAEERTYNVKTILSFKSLKSCMVIVTSRQFTALKLPRWNPNFASINITGFDDKNKQEYIGKYFAKYDSQYRGHVLAEINKSETLRSLGEIPLFLWLMCTLMMQRRNLPERITELFHDVIEVLYQQNKSKYETSSPSDTGTRDTFDKQMRELGRIALKGLMNQNGQTLYFDLSEFDSEDLVSFGCEVGLLTKTKITRGLKQVEYVTFAHKTFIEYCAATHLAGLATSDPVQFNKYMSQIFESDVESMEYLLRFCCGIDKKAAELIIRRTHEQLLKHNPKTSDIHCDKYQRYVYLHRMMMLVLFEAELGSLVKKLPVEEWVKFPYELKGEDLVAAHYFIKKLPKHSRLPYVSDINVMCGSVDDLQLVKLIVSHRPCKISLKLLETNMNGKLETLGNISRYLTSLCMKDCQLNNSDMTQLLQMFQSSGSIRKIDLSKNNFHGLQSVQITPIPSLETLLLRECSLMSDDIEPLFSLIASAGSIKKVFLDKNNFHGLQSVQITPIPSLETLLLRECSLMSDDIEPLFSLIASAGSIKKVFLDKNNFHGLQSVQITRVPSLEVMTLHECSLTSDDIEAVFSLIASAGSIKTVWLNKNNFHCLQSVQITPVPSLETLWLSECSLMSDDIEPLFSLIASAGSIKTVMLNKNNFHCLQSVQITPVPSLETLWLSECSLMSDDIEPLFSLIASAGSIKTVWLNKNNFHCLQSVQITPVPSLEEMGLGECSLMSDDIEALFSLVASAGSIKTVWLNKNNFHCLQSVQITPVPSLEEMGLGECSLMSDDIEALFSLVASAGSIKTVCLDENNFHGLQSVQITPVPSLELLILEDCSLMSDDIDALFSLIASAGSIKTVMLNKNNFHCLQSVQITPVPSLEGMTLHECSLTSDDIEPLFSLIASAGSIKQVELNKNDFHGLQSVQITPVPSLELLILEECSLMSDDIEALFSLVASAGSIKTVWLNKNNFHCLQSVQITPVPSLEGMTLHECSLTSDDIEPLFSLIASAGSIKEVFLDTNNFHGLQSVQITPVPSLEMLILQMCSLMSDDIQALFSLIAFAGKIKKVHLDGNNFHGLQSVRITPLPSLEFLSLGMCSVMSDDIQALFSILAACGSLNHVELDNNNFLGLQSVQITPLPSLEILILEECGLTSDDIEAVFSLITSAGSIKQVNLNKNDFHGLQSVQITPLPSLEILILEECSLTSDDIEAVFSLIASAGKIKEVCLSKNNFHGLQRVQITPVPSLDKLLLKECLLSIDEIEEIFCQLLKHVSVIT